MVRKDLLAEARLKWLTENTQLVACPKCDGHGRYVELVDDMTAAWFKEVELNPEGVINTREISCPQQVRVMNDGSDYEYGKMSPVKA